MSQPGPRRGRTTLSDVNTVRNGGFLVLPVLVWDGDAGPPGMFEHAVIYDPDANLEWDVSVGDTEDSGRTVFLNVFFSTQRPIASIDTEAGKRAFQNYQASLAAERARQVGDSP